MRRVSKKNSRYWVDDALNWEYRQANPYCEVSRYFPNVSRNETRIPGTPATIVHATETMRDHVHHISMGHSGNRRWDRKWNLLSVGWHAHTFIHDSPVDGLALCLYAKLRKGEWNHAEAFTTLGLNLFGKPLSQPCNHDFAERIRLAIIRESERNAG